MSCPEVDFTDEEYEELLDVVLEWEDDPNLPVDRVEVSSDDWGEVVYYCHECGRELYDEEAVVCSVCINEGLEPSDAEDCP